MKTEMLETLLLDRALGELSPEVTALLDAYLAQNPGAAPHASQWSDTLQLARTAMATPRETPRPLDLAALRRARQSARSRTWGVQAIGLAACLAIGLIAGLKLQPAPASVAVTTVVMPPSVRHVETTTDFWSLARFAPEKAKRQLEKKL